MPWLKGIYWSLAVEVQYYLWIALIFPFVVSSDARIRYGTLFLFCMGRWLNIEHSVFYYGCHFVSGILVFQFMVGIISKKELYIAMLICWGLTFWCFDVYHLTAVAGSILVIYFLNYNFKPLVDMGLISYSFYLIHIQVAWVIMDAYTRSYPQGNRYEQIFVSISFAILASAIFYYIIERPCHRLAKRI
jgi:peptidoglycan/LPS O-acetylase OafA/YrhL